MNILSNQPKFSFISSRDFYNSYYNNRDTIVVDLRDYQSYLKGHIDNSISFSIDSLFETYRGIPKRIKRVEYLIYTLSDAGIGSYKNVGIYSDKIEDSMVLASILYIFKTSGIFIIKDGIEGWKKENLPLSKKVNYVEKGYYPYKISATTYKNVILEFSDINNKDFDFVAISFNKINLIPNSIFLKPKFDFDRYVTGTYYASYGLARDKDILLYGDDNYSVLLTFFILKVFLDYPRVYIFNGGINEWIANNMPTK
jgi:3-mercaptopyruvate sulfurtransferase SseA